MDIIILDKNIFLENKDKNEINLVLKNKYDELYKKYTCFSNVNVIPPFLYKKKHENKNKNICFPKKYKKLSSIILGILNVLNNSNYLKKIKEIKLLKSEHNIEEIIKEILSKCCMQIFFLNIYIRLLRDLTDISSEKEKIIIFQVLNSYINNNYINDKEWLYTESTESVCEYDNFCNDQKKKTSIISKNMMVSKLLLNFTLDKTIDDYIILIVKDLKNNFDNENIIIIIIQMLNYIETVYKNKISQYLNLNKNIIIKKITGYKNKFIIEEFYKCIEL